MPKISQNIAFYAFFVNLVLFSYSCTNKTNAQNLNKSTVIGNLDTPWEILWGPDDFIWMTERRGVVSRVDPSNGNKHEILTLTDVVEQGESGLLGLALHPDFNNSPFVYLAYTYNSGGNIKEKIVRYNYSNNSLTDPKILIDNISGGNIHEGCRLVFGPDGKLYASTGETGQGNLAQDKLSLNGKILRMNDDGSIPNDNPFGNSYLWAIGSRNGQGLVWANGKLYESEHGPSTDDEVNIIQSGRNYGWPNVAGFCDDADEKQFCTDNNVVEPLKAWTPTLAVAGIDYYKTGPITEWNNSLLMVSLKAGLFIQMKLNSNGDAIETSKEYFAGEYGRMRDVCVSPDGRVFIATSNKDGRGSPKQDDDKIIELSSGTNSVKEKKKTSESSGLKVYPNPVKDVLQIEGLSKYAVSMIEITDVTGKMILKKETEINSNGLINLDIRHLPQGIYFIHSFPENGVKQTAKFIFQ